MDVPVIDKPRLHLLDIAADGFASDEDFDDLLSEIP